MGNLTPGARLIYERVDGVIYAREFGKNDRQVVGYESGRDYDPRTRDGRSLHEHIQEDKLWGDIRRTAQTNPTLRDALDRVIEIYQLIKKHE